MLRINSLEKRRGTFHLGPLEMEVGMEVLSVVGENGAGKTTLLNLVAGILRPDSGSVILEGEKLDCLPMEKRRIGYVFQRPYLFSHMSVYENVVYGLGNRESSRNGDRVRDIVSMLKIGEFMEKKVHELSAGEEQRIALARTLVTGPRVLLLDEPLNSLDIGTKIRLRSDLKELFRGLGIPVVYVTHEPREALDLAERVVVMGSGRILEEGPVHDVLRRPKTEYAKRLVEELA